MSNGAGRDESRQDAEQILGDVPSPEFRARLHELADWVADYREHIESFLITPRIKPGEIRQQFPASPPERSEDLRTTLAEFERSILPGLVHWGHPKFFGYFGTTTTAPGILGEMIAAAVNVSAMVWRTSPAATELEELVLDWIRQMLGLPDAFTGIVYDTASVAILHALAAAREATGFEARTKGLSGRLELPVFRIYASDQAHSSIEKAAITLGLGERNVIRVPTDAAYRMDVPSLRELLRNDLMAGYRPLAVIATVGATSTTSVDPVSAIADLCQEHGLWLHVDAAYGGAMGMLAEGRWVMDGVERADSVVFNPHKWLFVPLDFSALYVRQPAILRSVFTLVPEYLRGDAAESERNYMDYGIQLGRRFRALKAWMVIKTFGRQGIEARIREHIRLAKLFASLVQAEAGFEVLAPVIMGVVCFRALPGKTGDEKATDANEFNLRLLRTINATGEVYLTHTQLHERIALRLAIGNILTTEKHISETWQLIQAHARRARLA